MTCVSTAYHFWRSFQQLPRCDPYFLKPTKKDIIWSKGKFHLFLILSVHFPPWGIGESEGTDNITSFSFIYFTYLSSMVTKSSNWLSSVRSMNLRDIWGSTFGATSLSKVWEKYRVLTKATKQRSTLRIQLLHFLTIVLENLQKVLLLRETILALYIVQRLATIVILQF